MGQSKTMKLLLAGLKTKHDVTILRHHVIQFITQKKRLCNIPFNEVLLVSFCTCDLLAIIVVGSKKKDILPSFVNVNTLLFSI